MLQDVVEGGAVVGQDRLDRAGEFGQIVRRDVAGHGDRDAGRAVEQQIGRPTGEDRRLVQRLIEVWREVDRVLVEIGKHLLRDASQTRFRITHRSRWIVIN